jgi:ribose 5-phosphate isomerase B
MRIAIGSDLDGFEFKERLKARLGATHTLRDVCTSDVDLNSYHEVTDRLAAEIRAGHVDRGVLICSRCIGASVSANKFSRVRAAVCHEPDSARRGVEDEDMNLLVMGTNAVDNDLAYELTDSFLEAAHLRTPRPFAIHPRLLARIVEHIRDNLDAPLPVGELASLAEMSESYFSKLFKTDTGLTPHRFILHERINCSKELLRQGRARIVDVALDVGFQSQAHFTTAFASVVGVTPGQFQRSSNSAPLAETSPRECLRRDQQNDDFVSSSDPS